jgi:hypothetical protein
VVPSGSLISAITAIGNAESAGGRRIAIDIELGEIHLIAVLDGKSFHYGTKGLAGAAPRRPEVYRHRGLRLYNMMLKTIIIELRFSAIYFSF